MRWKPFRITEVWAKAAYVALAWVPVPYLMRWLLGLVGIPDTAILAVDIAGGFVVIGFGCRVFRARGEAVDPPRAWWRATGKPTAGYVLFAFFSLALIGSFIPYPEPVDPFVWWYVVTGIPIAAFYLHSSIRLARGDAPELPQRPRDDDARYLSRKRSVV